MVYIIIVNYNGSDDTIECIKSLSGITYKDYKILVIDNDSRQEEIKKLEKYKNDNFRLIKLAENVGFAKANNIGMKMSVDEGAEYALLLNNDTTVKENFLEELISTFHIDKNIGIATGLILNYFDNSEKWYSGGKINWFKYEGENDTGKVMADNIKEVELASGCMMLIKRELIEKKILLPEDYFMFYEDIDYCAIVKNSGYKLAYNDNSIIYHKISKSSGGEKSVFYFKYSTRNRIIFMKKYKNKSSNYIMSLIYFYFNRLSRIIYFLFTNKIDKSKAIIMGIKEGIKFS